MEVEKEDGSYYILVPLFITTKVTQKVLQDFIEATSRTRLNFICFSIVSGPNRGDQLAIDEPSKVPADDTLPTFLYGKTPFEVLELARSSFSGQTGDETLDLSIDGVYAILDAQSLQDSHVLMVSDSWDEERAQLWASHREDQLKAGFGDPYEEDNEFHGPLTELRTDTQRSHPMYGVDMRRVHFEAALQVAQALEIGSVDLGEVSFDAFRRKKEKS